MKTFFTCRYLCFTNVVQVSRPPPSWRGYNQMGEDNDINSHESLPQAKWLDFSFLTPDSGTGPGKFSVFIHDE